MARQDADAQHDKRVQASDKKRGAVRGKRNGSIEPVRFFLEHWMLLGAFGHVAFKEGGAFRVGLTRDGGAVALGVYAGDEYGTEYIRPSEDFQTALREIADAWFQNGGLAFDDAVFGMANELKMARGK